MKRIDLSGKRFGRLIAFKDVGISEHRGRLWECECDCGNKRVVEAYLLRNKNTQSCGCLQSEKRSEGNPKHGLHGTRIYATWKHIIRRCYSKSSHIYRYYGGRGIRACEAIRSSPLHLFTILGYRPDGKSINRINNLLHYSCGDCAECIASGWPMNIEWATPTEQMRNRRNTIFITIGEQSKSLPQWAEEHGIPQSTIYQRLHRGWFGERLLDPVNTKYRSHP